MTEDPIVVDIVDVIPGAVVIDRRELTVDDTVFDVFGGRHRLRAVAHFKHCTRGTRVDGGRFWLEDGETMTVIKGA